jgi:lipopolysaccharide export system protein LptA
VAMAAVVSLVVYQQWKPSASEQARQTAPVVELPTDDRRVESVTEALNVIQSSNGRPVFSIVADEHVDFVDGWNVWEQVELVLFGLDPDGTDDDVRIVGERMRTSGEMGRFDEVRIVGSVVADLPGSGTFETRRIDYDAVSGLVENCNRNSLTYAGLEVVSNCLEFRTGGDLSAGEAVRAEDLRMWGELSIRASPAGGGTLPEELRGGAAEMRFQPGGNIVNLTGEPFLDFGAAVVRSRELVLDVGEAARQLRSVDASGGARMRYRQSPASFDEAGDVVESDDDLIVRAGHIVLDLTEDTELSRMLAEEDAEQARLQLPGLGVLSSGRVEMTPSTEAQPQRITATGSVGWAATGETAGLRYLGTDRLDLEVEGDKPRRLNAQGSVMAALESTAAEVREFTGDALQLRWNDDGTMAEGSWPDGVRFSTMGRALEAGRADYEPATSSWRLSGDPRPAVSDPQLGLGADTMVIGDDGSLWADGDVRGSLGGDTLSAAGALFGGVELVQVRAGRAVIDAAGALSMEQRVEIVWEEQSLVADSLRIETGPGRLRARRDVELVAVERGEEGGFVTVTADNLLVEEETSEIRLAGDAVMRRADRDIEAERLTVSLDEAGAWRSVLAEEAVSYRDPQGEASGETLLYDLETAEILLTGSEDLPATFRLDDIEYSSTEALRILFQDDEVVIEATEEGRTRTSVVPREGTG